MGYDKTDEDLGLDNFDHQFRRNSEDKNLNSRGKDLLDICKLNDLLILNGRVIGDVLEPSLVTIGMDLALLTIV